MPATFTTAALVLAALVLPLRLHIIQAPLMSGCTGRSAACDRMMRRWQWQ